MTELTGGQVGQVASIDVMQSLGDGRTAVSGTVGQRLLASDFNINVLRPSAGDADNIDLSVNAANFTTNAVLMDQEWRSFDNVVQQVARERLPAVTDIISRGLVYNLPNALGVMDLQWERVKGDLVDAEVTMSGLPEATKDRMETELVRMPIPLFHKEFFYNLRHLAAARRHGRELDTEHASVASRKISELIEYTLFNGLTIAGSTIYGLATEPNRKTLSVTANWATTATGEQIVSDIIRMIDTATKAPNNMDGPFTLYIPWSVAARFGNDYKANSDKTIEQRIREIPGLAGIQWTNRLSGTSALLVQMTSDVVQMINGIQPTMVEWESHGGFQHNFKIIAIMLPRVRSNGWQQSGIVHIS